jgi:hypothetical protein
VIIRKFADPHPTAAEVRAHHAAGKPIFKWNALAQRWDAFTAGHQALQEAPDSRPQPGLLLAQPDEDPQVEMISAEMTSLEAEIEAL